MKNFVHKITQYVMFLDLNTKLFWSAEQDDQMTEADEGSLGKCK